MLIPSFHTKGKPVRDDDVSVHKITEVIHHTDQMLAIVVLVIPRNNGTKDTNTCVLEIGNIVHTFSLRNIMGEGQSRLSR